MMIRALAAIVLLTAASAAAAGKPPAKPAAPGQSGDVEVSIVLANGQRINYGTEVRQLQIVLNSAGSIETVHLVLAKGSSDTNTHEWYAFRNLAGFSYRY